MEKVYEIHRVTGGMDWDTLPVLKMEHAYLGTPESITAFGQICATRESFFVRLWANQPSIRAEENGISGLPYLDSCLEFFFCPEAADPRYFNFEFNFNKCLYLGIGTDKASRQRILLENREELFKPVTQRTKQGWEVRYQIPFTFIQEYFPKFTVYEGKALMANCFTCADLAEIPYYRSWSDVHTEPFTFHSASCFGVMKIV